MPDENGADGSAVASGTDTAGVSTDSASRGDSRGLYGIIAGLAINVSLALVTMFGFEGFIASNEFLILWLSGNFLFLPIGLYFDAWHLRTTSDWTGRPVIWTVLAAVPAVNIAVAAFYLAIRGSLDPFLGGTPA